MKNFIIYLLLAMSIRQNAQTITVRDLSSREVIAGVLIRDEKEHSVMTDLEGKADLSVFQQGDTLSFIHLSYNVLKLVKSESLFSKPVEMVSKTVYLDEIVFAASRHSEKKIDVPYSMTLIKQREIEFANQPTSAELLQNTGNVFVQKSQMGGGSPVMRGFEANKVLIVVDGVRMNNAIYRGGHLQDVITLDANMLDHTEIIFGPASTMYGSDALGGVMHFYTKSPVFSEKEEPLIKANVMTRYATVNQEKTGHLDFNFGLKKFASMTNVTYSDFGDLRSGTNKLSGVPNSWDCNYYVDRYTTSSGIGRDTMLKNPDNNVMKRSGYDQLDIMQRFKLKTGAHLTHDLNFQYSTSGEINRYDRLSETSTGTIMVANPSTNGFEKTNKLRFSEWYYGPQKRMLGAYTLNHDGATVLSDNVRFIAAYQKIDQDRISRSFQSNNRTSQMEDVSVVSANLDVFKRIKEKHELRYGAEFTYNDVKSTAQALDITTNTVSAAKTRYGDNGNSMMTNGVYVSHSWEVNENFVISDGLRFTANSLESNFRDTTFYKFPFTKATQNNQAITGSLGFTWKEEENYKVSLLANTGFRTPNIDDMSKVFESTNNVLIVPNADLKPEYATNFEMGFSKILDKNYRFDVNAYYTLINNILVQADYKFNGSDSAMFNGSKKKTQAMQNRDRGYIYGGSAGVQFDFNKNVTFKSTINYVYGRYADVAKDTVLPLDHIPPVFGQSSLIMKMKRVDGEFFVRYNGTKRSSDYSASGEDNKQYSADRTNGYMPSWFTINARFGLNVTNNLRINFACENISDNRYRVFASGINGPGRNFIISLRYKI